MAVKTFEEIYSQLSADEKKVFDNAIAKEPELKDGWLRRDDYSRKTQELSSEKKKFEDRLSYADRMENWAKEYVPVVDGLMEKGVIDQEGNNLWESQKAQLEKDLEDARKAALTGGEMKPEELDQRVRQIIKDAGTALSTEEVKALYASEGKKMAQEVFDENWTTKEKNFNEKTIPFVSGFSAGVAVVASRFERETGEPWTADKQKELFDLMSKEQNFDPFKMEEKLLAPHKEKKEREKVIEEEVNKRVSKMRETMPGAGGEDFIPNPEQKGALQVALEQSGSGDFESMIRSKAVEAAKALHQEGK
jgi:hypothetical protein